MPEPSVAMLQALNIKVFGENADLKAQVELLKHGGGGGTSGPMEPAVPLKDYVDARDEAVETRLMAKLDQLSTKGTIWGAAGTVIAIILAVMAFGGDRFDSGMDASNVVETARKVQAETDAKQDERLRQIDSKLDLLIQRTAKAPTLGSGAPAAN